MSPEITSENLARALPIPERFGVTVATAAAFVGISRSRIYELLAAGELDGRIIGGRRIVVVDSLMRMIGEAPPAKRGAA
jgi:excisionase family DNA binding protein